MDSISTLYLLTEAVRNAGADIAPTYQEYIQLTFAVATDCGEAGRYDFLTLCSLSPKYDAKVADRFFSNMLKTGHCEVDLGTAFHLAERCSINVQYEQLPPESPKSSKIQKFTPPIAHTHACAEEEVSGRIRTGCANKQHGAGLHTGSIPAKGRRDGHQERDRRKT